MPLLTHYFVFKAKETAMKNLKSVVLLALVVCITTIISCWDILNPFITLSGAIYGEGILGESRFYQIRYFFRDKATGLEIMRMSTKHFKPVIANNISTYISNDTMLANTTNPKYFNKNSNFDITIEIVLPKTQELISRKTFDISAPPGGWSSGDKIILPPYTINLDQVSIPQPTAHGIAAVILDYRDFQPITELYMRVEGYNLIEPDKNGYFTLDLKSTDSWATVYFLSIGAMHKSTAFPVKSFYPTRIDVPVPRKGYTEFEVGLLPDGLEDDLVAAMKLAHPINVNKQKGLILGNITNKAGYPVENAIVRTDPPVGRVYYSRVDGAMVDTTTVVDGYSLSAAFLIPNVDTSLIRTSIKVLAFNDDTGETLGVREHVVVSPFEKYMTLAPIVVRDSIKPAPINDLQFLSKDKEGYLTWTATGDDSSSGKAYRYRLYRANKNVNREDTTAFYRWLSNDAVLIKPQKYPAEVSTPETLWLNTVRLLDKGGNYYLLQACDESANCSEFSNLVEYNTLDVNQPMPLEVTLSSTLTQDGIIIYFYYSGEKLPTIDFFDINGRIVHKHTLTNIEVAEQKYIWSGDNLPNGIYFISAHFQAKTLNEKVLLMR
jgi:hypothetical protein